MKNKPIAKILHTLGMAGILSLAQPAHATSFVDTFEDGSLKGWLLTNTGTNGTTNVQEHNGSQMAFVQRIGGPNSVTSLSRDFSYVSSDSLSFDMQAIATLSTTGNSYSGVRLTFMSSLNLPLGVVGFYNSLGQTTRACPEFCV